MSNKDEKPGRTVEIRLVREWDAQEILALYHEADWWRDEYDPAQIPVLIRDSFAFGVAVDSVSGRAVGMGRVLSDGISDAYIQDLVVRKECRKTGVGRSLLASLLSYCMERGVTWIALIAQPGTENFYTPSGFIRMEGYVPMIYHSAERKETDDAHKT